MTNPGDDEPTTPTPDPAAPDPAAPDPAAPGPASTPPAGGPTYPPHAPVGQQPPYAQPPAYDQPLPPQAPYAAPPSPYPPSQPPYAAPQSPYAAPQSPYPPTQPPYTAAQYGPPGGVPYSAGGGMYSPVRETNSKALISLIAGIGSFAVCPGILGVVAVILGNSATDEIEASAGTQEGESLAKAGIILGWISIAIVAVFLIFMLVLFAIGIAAQN